MEPNNTQPAIDNQNMPPVSPAPQGDKKVGPIIASLIIVLVLIFAALYVFASRITQPIIPDDSTGDTEQATTSNSVKPVTSTSTDVKSMQADLNASTNGLDNKNF